VLLGKVRTLLPHQAQLPTDHGNGILVDMKEDSSAHQRLLSGYESDAHRQPDNHSPIGHHADQSPEEMENNKADIRKVTKRLNYFSKNETFSVGASRRRPTLWPKTYTLVKVGLMLPLISQSNKPIMEKRRRARINNCLNDLKGILLEAMRKDPARHSKLEKADILELTVRHLQNVQRNQLAIAMASDPTVLHRFKNGFSECATEVGSLSRSISLSLNLKCF